MECKGIGVGRAHTQGSIRIVKNLDDPAVEGKILVLDYPSVAYANLIRRSIGFIAEQGGILSHGCTLALELGLPAVVGLAKARRLFHDGDLVELDATTGVVKKL